MNSPQQDLGQRPLEQSVGSLPMKLRNWAAKFYSISLDKGFSETFAIELNSANRNK